MGAAQSHLLYQIPSPPTYDRSLDDLIWIHEGGMEIPAIYREWKGDNGDAFVFCFFFSFFI